MKQLEATLVSTKAWQLCPSFCFRTNVNCSALSSMLVVTLKSEIYLSLYPCSGGLLHINHQSRLNKSNAIAPCCMFFYARYMETWECSWGVGRFLRLLSQITKFLQIGWMIHFYLLSTPSPELAKWQANGYLKTFQLVYIQLKMIWTRLIERHSRVWHSAWLVLSYMRSFRDRCCLVSSLQRLWGSAPYFWLMKQGTDKALK